MRSIFFPHAGSIAATMAAALIVAGCGGPAGTGEPGILDRLATFDRQDGFIDLYWDADGGRLLLGIDRFDAPLLYQSSLARGVGSNDLGLDRGQLGRTRVVRFERSGPKILLVEDNLAYRARSDDPLDRVFRRLDAVCEMVVRRRNRKGGCLIGNLSTTLSDTHPAFRKRLGACFDEMASEFQTHLDEAAASRGLSGDQDTGEMARYIVSVIEGAIMLSRTHRDISVIERHVQHLKEDLKRSFQTADQLKGAMSR